MHPRLERQNGPATALPVYSMAKAKPSKKRARTPASKSLVDFDRPPVNEVVCGVGFRALEGLTPAYIGLWWSENRTEFPKVRPAAPILGHAEGDHLPLSGRNMFVSDDETQIVQLQATRFYYNWVRTRDSQVYPRFSKVYKEFTSRLTKFEDFVKQNNIGRIAPIEYALTYVNHIPQGEAWKALADIKTVLPDISWRKSTRRRYLSEPAGISLQYVFPIKDQPGRLTVILQRVVRKSDQVSLLRFELKAEATDKDGLPPHSVSSMSNWFHAAREAIVLGFLDLTSETAQIKVWGRRD